MSEQPKTEIWLASTDEESWGSCEEYGSRDEAIKNYPLDYDLDDGSRFYTGRKWRPVYPVVHPKGFTFMLQENFNDQMADFDFDTDLGLSVERQVELAKLVNEAIAKFFDGYSFRFFVVRDVEQHTFEDKGGTDERDCLQKDEG